jgi:Ribbon-helix-helix protein, copG family
VEERVSTNVRLDPAKLRQLKKLAVERGVTLSAIFQEMIAEYVGREGALTGKNWENDPCFKIGRRPGRSGLSRVAEQHDRYLYRTKR